MPAETAHHLTFRLIHGLFRIPGVARLAGMFYKFHHPSLNTEVFGIRFSNPIGIAAGFDKDARLIDPLSVLGFGFVEIGTVTPRPQPGNDRPRLFRLPQDQALINRMGFNNLGVEQAVRQLKQRKSQVVIGGNIGKNKETPNDRAFEDYLVCYRALYPWVDYFVVNVSSPNTPGLRDLQAREPLTDLLRRLQEENKKTGSPKPLLLKIAPDLTDEQLDDIIAIIRDTGISGVVATNTTTDRKGLRTPQQTLEKLGPGGLSGLPLQNRATEVIRYIHHKSSGSIPIIGVGGIFTFQDAWEKLQAGASLVQVYTGFIYQGPRMVKKMNKSIARHWSKTN